MKRLKYIGFFIALAAFLTLNILQVNSVKNSLNLRSSITSREDRKLAFEIKEDGTVRLLGKYDIKDKVVAKLEQPIVKTKNIKKNEMAVAPVVERIIDYKSSNLAIILTEVGSKKNELEVALGKLPKEVTVAFTPYADDLKAKMADVKKSGHEVLLNLMFEPSNFPINDTGPLTVQGYFDETQKALRLQSTFVVGEGFKGVLSNTDEILTHNFENLTPVLKILKNKDYFFGYYRKSVNANLENDVKPLGLDNFIVDYLIDEKPDEESINKKLDEAKEEIVLRKKKIIIALRAYPVSINAVNEWLRKNSALGIQPAPISYFITDN